MRVEAMVPGQIGSHGLGYLAVVSQEDVAVATRTLTEAGERVREVGEIVPGARSVELV